MRINSIARKLIGVEAIFVKDISIVPNGLVFDLVPSWHRPRCGICGEKCPGYDTSAESRLWRHLPLGGVVIWLRYKIRRVECPVHRVVTEKVPWAVHDDRFTREMTEMIAYLTQRMDKTAVCTLMGINWRTVNAVVIRVVKERLDPKRFDGLYKIGLDEISYRRHHKYLTVVIDHAMRRVVWAADGKSGETLDLFFDKLGPDRGKMVTDVTMDMSQAYIETVRKRIPGAQIVFDRFHVQKLAGNAVDEVRRREYGLCENEEDARFIKHSRWALLKNPWNLTRKEGAKLREVAWMNKRIFRAYLLRETLAEALEQTTLGRARKRLDEWIGWASRSSLAPFVKVARTIRKYKDGILAYIETHLTNGLVEGLNNRIRLITRRAYGFHSHESLISMVYLCCGGIKLNPSLPQPT